MPDIRLAREHGLPVIHRSELLAEYVAAHRTIAVAGTSGKSTVVAMVFEVLRALGRDPSVITGGDLLVLRRGGLWGNAWAGGSDLLVVEADESDGSLVRYAPSIGVILNLQRDHHEPATVAEMFRTFASRTQERLVVADDGNLDEFARGTSSGTKRPIRFGLGPGADVHAGEIELTRDGSRFAVDGATCTLPVPGLHNVRNAVAALAACRALDVTLAAAAGPLADLVGVGRRFEVVGTARGVEVVDDFAHNPEKVRAALATAALRGRRTLAVYQPHGFGPTRFLRDDLVRAFAEALRPADRLWFLPIYYAGGTAARDISSDDLAREIRARGRTADAVPDRAALVGRIAEEARAGDVVLVMGARDPSLAELARAILEACATREARAAS